MVLVTLIGAAALHLLTPAGGSFDLAAVWRAGAAFGLGDLGNVYPVGEDVFTLLPPQAWLSDAAPGESVFPFIYPPLWAVVASWLQPVMAFEEFAAGARIANALLLAATVALGWRATRSGLPLVLYAAIGLAALHLTFVGHLALLENQPQILVSFLIVASIERARAGDGVTAGTVLAIAASIKLYPVLFVVIWIATRNGRALAAFTVVGAALGGLSVALAGWPLHALFLDQIATIARSLVLTPVSYTIAPAIAQIVSPEIFSFVPATSGSGGRLVAPLPELAGWLGRAGLLCVLVAAALAAARSDDETRHACLWPALITGAALLSPLSWSYHFIPAVALAPALFDRLSARAACLALVLALGPATVEIVALYLDADIVRVPAQLGGTLGMIALALAFVLAARRTRRQGLHPGRAPL